ncbi:MAG: hypothetical protein BroJett018_51260 [Chloroflexota bacterium]|nr:MAG: hypothetical protein BroJett018_51260 [Chloroflexota bacterium]
MSVKHQALPKIHTPAKTAVATRHPLIDLYDIMTWWERISFGIVIASTVICLVLLVLLLNGQL